MKVNPASVVSPEARIGNDVVIGPFCVIEPDVTIGDGCILDSHVVVKDGTVLGPENHIHETVTLGGIPQHRDLPEITGALVIGAGNTIRENVTIHRALHDGAATTIGDDNLIMVGAHIADPEIVNKLRAGEEDSIRPCVGAGYCLDRIYEGGGTLCIHNAATGREATMPHVIEKSTGPKKRVVVVGGGHFGCFVPYPAGVAPENARFVFEEMECYHCFWRCPKRAGKNDVFPCIDAISEDMVWSQAEALLAEGVEK